MYCHLPHNANPAGSGLAPLWARSLRSITGASVYSSTRLSGGNLDTTKISLLCLSCHDGGASLGTLWTAAVISWNPTRAISGRTQVGPTLTNDHPVGFAYPLTGTSASDSGLASRFTITGRGYTLYNGNIECASCHEVHIWSATTTDASYKFKRTVTGAPNNDFCLGCHDQK